MEYTNNDSQINSFPTVNGTRQSLNEANKGNYLLQAKEINSKSLEHAQTHGIETYLKPGEEFLGLGLGGSEALIIFVRSPEREEPIVRKIWSENFFSVDWDPGGSGVMAPPLSKAQMQVEYIQGLPDEVKLYFPEILDFQETRTELTDEDGKPIGHQRTLICEQSYIPGVEVSSFIKDNQVPPYIVAHIHREIFACLREQIHCHRKRLRTEPTLEASYFGKIRDRLQLSQETAPSTLTPLFASDYIWINGQRHSNILPLLTSLQTEEASRILEPKWLSLVMGDSNTENVKITNIAPVLAAMESGDEKLDFTYTDLGLRFIDPRAIGFNSTGAEVVDDYMYDNKPLHNSSGKYDMMHGDHFDIEFRIEDNEPHISILEHNDNPFKKPYTNIEEHFQYILDGWGTRTEEFLREDPYWLVRFSFVMGTHFASMLPFHFHKEKDGRVLDDPISQKRAIALYCEGIKWLNMTEQMMSGEKNELFGIPVPQLSN